MKNKVLDSFDLKGALALITGGAGYLGEKHAEAILEGNGKVVLVDIDREKLNGCVDRLAKRYGNNVWGKELDITNEENVRATLVAITEEVGEIDILINNAANNPQVKTAQTNSSFTRLENFSREMLLSNSPAKQYCGKTPKTRPSPPCPPPSNPFRSAFIKS